MTALGGVSEPDGSEVAAKSRSLVWNVPVLRDPHFVGRDDLLGVIEAELSAAGTAALTHTVTQAVSGLGGIGKTALAAEFAYRQVANYDVVWWLRAEEQDALASDFAALSAALGLTASSGGREDAIAAVRRWLAEHGRWLLVFDNARRPEDVEPYLPGLRGHVLVTSRNPRWATLAKVIDVPALDLAAAAELVVRRTGVEDFAGARRLAGKLDGVPKVIEVAADLFARSASASLAGFADRLGDGGVATQGVWDGAFHTALAVRGTRRVLASCTALDPDDIDTDLLACALGLSARSLDNAVGALLAQQILRRRVNGLATHRLVQAAARDRLPPAERRHAARQLAAHLAGIDTDTQPTLLPLARRVQAHTPYLVAALGTGEPAARLLRWYTQRLSDDGAYRPAYEAARKALAATEAAMGAAHPDAGYCLRLLAWTLQDLGDHAAARHAAERALAITEAAFGPDHADVGRCQHTLARILRDLGDLGPAREAVERALAVTEAALGPDHPNVGWDLEILATILQDAGKPAAARATARRALAVTEAALGAGHLVVAQRREALAAITGR